MIGTSNELYRIESESTLPLNIYALEQVEFSSCKVKLMLTHVHTQKMNEKHDKYKLI